MFKILVISNFEEKKLAGFLVLSDDFSQYHLVTFISEVAKNLKIGLKDNIIERFGGTTKSKKKTASDAYNDGIRKIERSNELYFSWLEDYLPTNYEFKKWIISELPLKELIPKLQEKLL